MTSIERSRRTLAIAGATGLIGSRCLERLISDASVAEIVVLSRRPLSVTNARLRVEIHPDLTQLQPDGPGHPPNTDGGTIDAALCALGTTIKKAGSQAAFRAVDHDAVLAFARWARARGAKTFVLCSSVGADPNSANFYLRTKGEVEAAIRALRFQRFVAVRPSLLLGDRAESRPGERFARAVMPALNPLLIGGLRRYRGVSADSVAGAMVSAARELTEGDAVWENRDIVARSGGGP